MIDNKQLMFNMFNIFHFQLQVKEAFEWKRGRIFGSLRQIRATDGRASDGFKSRRQTRCRKDSYRRPTSKSRKCSQIHIRSEEFLVWWKTKIHRFLMCSSDLLTKFPGMKLISGFKLPVGKRRKWKLNNFWMNEFLPLLFLTPPAKIFEF